MLQRRPHIASDLDRIGIVAVHDPAYLNKAWTSTDEGTSTEVGGSTSTSTSTSSRSPSKTWTTSGRGRKICPHCSARCDDHAVSGEGEGEGEGEGGGGGGGGGNGIEDGRNGAGAGAGGASVGRDGRSQESLSRRSEMVYYPSGCKVCPICRKSAKQNF